MEVTRNTFFLSVGSNLGDRLLHLQNGLNALQNHGCEILSCSSVYETAAVGMNDAPAFLNACVKGTTDLNPFQLMDLLLMIEQKNGRNRSTVGVNSRTLDMDVLFYENLVLVTDKLILPHPRFRQRKFVLLPLLEIAPEFIDPVKLKPIQLYLVEIDDCSEVKKLDPERIILRF
jgi:deoxyguanosine kinase